MKRTHEKERIAALSAGLAVIILLWIGAQAFFSDWMESSEALSIWFYGPVSAAAWGLLSLIAYGLIIRAQRRNPALCHEHEEALREKRLAKTGDLSKVPVCIEEVDAIEKDKLGALMGGFAITIAGWLAIFSFAPSDWLDSVIDLSPWIYCLASIALWSSSAQLMYWSFRRTRHHHSSLPHAH